MSVAAVAALIILVQVVMVTTLDLVHTFQQVVAMVQTDKTNTQVVLVDQVLAVI
jgi:hypothetical protein